MREAGDTDEEPVAAEELRRVHEELAEARQQQIATAEILKVISSSPANIQPVFDVIAEQAVRVCDGQFCAVFHFDGEFIHIGALHGVSPEGEIVYRQGFPLRAGSGSAIGRAVQTRAVVHIPDVEADAHYKQMAIAQAVKFRSVVALPILREGIPIGGLAVSSSRAEPFSDARILLLRSFADQAAIALENVRLFNEITDALGQQTATSEILKVISSSPTDVQPVFDAIASSALRIFDSTSVAVFLEREGRIELGAVSGNSERMVRELRTQFPRPLDRDTASGRTILDRAVQHFPDVAAPDVPVGVKAISNETGMRAILAAPMLREGAAIGAIVLTRSYAGPFSNKLIALLQTFADQAVIAIQNVRLFNETKEALERQTATAEILKVISSSPTDVQPVFNIIGALAERLCVADVSVVSRFDGELLQLVALHGVAEEGAELVRRAFPMRAEAETVTARAFRNAAVIHIADVLDDPDYGQKGTARTAGYRASLGVPMLREGQVIGVIFVARTTPGYFADTQVELLETFADQAVIAIENVRLFRELQFRNSALSEALEQQTATSDILRAISRSQTDAQPVFETIAAHALKLCEAGSASVTRFDGNLVHSAAVAVTDPQGAQAIRNLFPRPLGRDITASRAIMISDVVAISDVLEDPEYVNKASALAGGFRSALAVPLMSGNNALGAITVGRARPGPFPDKQISLLKTFADQAVIAIENVRLFKELEARTEALTRSVEEMRALGEVGQAVSSTLDLDAVLAAIIKHAVELSKVDAGGTIYEFDEAAGVFVPRANHGVSEAYVRTLRESQLRLGETAIGLCAVNRSPYQVPDVATGEDSRMRETLLKEGIRAVLAVPLLREDRVIGALVIRRRVAGEFSPSVVTLLQAMAGQSVLAIQNARLFREIAEKGRQLEVASQLKSQFLANMSHELRTPLNAIIGVTEMLHEDAVDLKRSDDLEPLERVLRAARHLLALINDILDLSKIEAGKIDIHLESFAIAPLVNDVVQTIATMATKNENKVVVECPDGIGMMNGDQTRIRQALLNLASNANKFTERGTVTISARRAIEAGREWVTMAVADTGIGLTQEQMGKLFQDFVQADASITRKYGGTGLGLAISRRFCQMMGGDITVTSELGRGSTFTIRVPVDCAASRAAAAPHDPALPRAGTAQSGAPTILVVDDDQTVREVMERHLAREGFSVVTANGGHEGLRLARELHPCAITLDVMMPDLDGWTVLAAIKGDPELADIPVILISIVDEKNRGYALGATDYMVKPVNREQLSSVLRKICGAAGRRLLLVDDDDTMRRTVRVVLEKDGWEVREAENGRIALARLSEARPDIIMLDLMMPEMDGFEFLVEMRGHPEWRDIPVLVVTAKDLTAEERGRLNGEVEHVLQKGGSNLDELLREIGRKLLGSIERGERMKAENSA